MHCDISSLLPLHSLNNPESTQHRKQDISRQLICHLMAGNPLVKPGARKRADTHAQVLQTNSRKSKSLKNVNEV